MAGLQIPIVLLPPRADATGDFYFEIQEIGGGAGSSKKLLKSQLATAILSALFPLDHSSLSDLGADDHPQYLNEVRGDARYTPIGHLNDVNPHPQYQTNTEVDAQIDAKIAIFNGLPDPFPQYETSAEAQAKVDTKMAAHVAAADPHPQYETSAEAQAKVDTKMAAHVVAADPHPQYASNADLEAEVASAVGPIAQAQVADYIATEGETLIDAAVAEQVGPAVDAGIAAHEAEANPHPQYKRNAVTTVVPSAGGIIIDCSLGDYFYCELTENVTVTITNPPVVGDGQTIYIEFKQDAIGGRTVTLPATFKPNGGSDTEVATAAEAYTALAATTISNGVRWGYTMQDIT